MVRGHRSVGLLLVGALGGCSGYSPVGSGEGVERTPIVGGAADSTDKPVFGIVIDNMALCTGSLIAPNLVLTARHCVAPLSSGDQPVNCSTDTFGATYDAGAFIVTYDANITDGAAQSSLFGAAEVRVKNDDAFCGNDAAVLILDSNVPESGSTTLEPRVDEMPMTNEPFKAIGYGLNSPNDVQGTSAGIRRSMSNLEVGCVGAVECAGTRATNTEWAANAPVCSGDSGGPALDADGKVIGIASRSDETCALGLYTAVASFKDLIVDAAKDAAERGGYDTPTWASGGSSMGGSAGSSGGMPAAGASSGGKAGAAGAGANGGAGGSGAMGGSSGMGEAGSDATGGSSSAGKGSGGSAGRMGSAGTTGSAGRGAAGASNGGAPIDNPTLGEECTASCATPYLCYAATGKPPGECVPPCSESNKTCPKDFRCSVDLNACLPVSDSGDSGDDDDDTKSDSGCGCRVTPVGDAAGNAWHAVGALALALAAARRRRRMPRA